MYRGITIIGDSLTDSHLDGVIERTKKLADAHSATDQIVHESDNRVSRRWDDGAVVIYLDLVDGRWDIDNMVCTISCSFGRPADGG
ncbi:hypothetical protein RBSWK_01570 [Rhodopirellula baltica SWK14]|uniref:Uncharacterized protein n=1 Tax=Rhodopirellula baltica SWK14 TaxID=993516 RepID=L7CJS4_RHOBT|nr:hypothetical protein RBSWK_01570 [Rhodopirellula baltica SWK14]